MEIVHAAQRDAPTMRRLSLVRRLCVLNARGARTAAQQPPLFQAVSAPRHRVVLVLTPACTPHSLPPPPTFYRTWHTAQGVHHQPLLQRQPPLMAAACSGASAPAVLLQPAQAARVAAQRCCPAHCLLARVCGLWSACPACSAPPACLTLRGRQLQRHSALLLLHAHLGLRVPPAVPAMPPRTMAQQLSALPRSRTWSVHYQRAWTLSADCDSLCSLRMQTTVRMQTTSSISQHPSSTTTDF
jgi:hypothetical protein